MRKNILILLSLRWIPNIPSLDETFFSIISMHSATVGLSNENVTVWRFVALEIKLRNNQGSTVQNDNRIRFYVVEIPFQTYSNVLRLWQRNAIWNLHWWNIGLTKIEFCVNLDFLFWRNFDKGNFAELRSNPTFVGSITYLIFFRIQTEFGMIGNSSTSRDVYHKASVRFWFNFFLDSIQKSRSFV